MQPQEWVRAEPWQPGPGLMSAMGLGAGGGEDGARADEEPVSRGESADGAQSEAVSQSEPSGSELVSREELSGQAEEPVSRGESMSREANEPGERGGSEAMWRSAIGERSEAVGRMAAVQAPKGVRLRPRPELGGAGGTDLGTLPFGESVHVQRRTEHGWCSVVVVGSGAAGFVEQHFLAMDPPDPGARLLLVKPGDKLHAVVSRHYAVRKGSDARLYVQAIVEANRGRRGVYLDEGELGFVEEVLRTESAERTVETYRGAKVRKGNAIWLPSESFVAALRSLGAIGSGESIPSAAWRGAKAMAGAALDGARYAAAFTIGLLEGGFGAVVDLFSGAAELVQTVAKVALELFTGDGAALVAMARGWVSKLQKVWENRGAIAEDFLSKWESDDAWTRGTFQGEVLGWVMMTVLLCIATAGAGALAATGQLSGRWAAVLRALAALDALGDVTTYVGAAARLPAKAAGHVRGKLGMSTKPAASASAPTERASTGAWTELDEPQAPSAHKLELQGLAQSPRLVWRRNPDGAVRTPEEAVALARRWGVEIDEDIVFIARDPKAFPSNTLAEYFGRKMTAGSKLSWRDFLNAREEVAVKISREILHSDEACVAVIAHEMHELNGLRRMFEVRETIPAEEVYRLINPGIKGNLHDQAWDVADQVVVKMRAAGAAATKTEGL